ncbi:MAG: hypothetical protein QG673_1317 [Pseudomonadota bacterium]|nr:hypothetical protein [Pseudomonadota bacterium]
MSFPLNRSSINANTNFNVSVVIPSNSNAVSSTGTAIDPIIKSQLTDLLAQFGVLCSYCVTLDGRKNPELSQHRANTINNLINKLLSKLEQPENRTQQYEMPHQTSDTNNEIQDLTELNQDELTLIFESNKEDHLMHTKTSLVIVEVYVEGQKNPIYMLMENRDKSVIVSPQKRRVENQIKSLMGRICNGKNGGIIPNTDLCGVFYYSVDNSQNDELAKKIKELNGNTDSTDTSEKVIKSAINSIIKSGSIDNTGTSISDNHTKNTPFHDRSNYSNYGLTSKTNKRKRFNDTDNSNKVYSTSTKVYRTSNPTTVVPDEAIFIEMLSEYVSKCGSIGDLLRKIESKLSGSIKIYDVDMAHEIFNALYDNFKSKYQESRDCDKFVQNVANLYNSYDGPLIGNTSYTDKLIQRLNYMLQICNRFHYVDMSTQSDKTNVDYINKILNKYYNEIYSSESTGFTQENMVITPNKVINMRTLPQEEEKVFNQIFNQHHYAVIRTDNNYTLWHINSAQEIKAYKISKKIGRAFQEENGVVTLEKILSLINLNLRPNDQQLFKGFKDDLFNVYTAFIPKLRHSKQLVMAYDDVFYTLGMINMGEKKLQDKLNHARNAAYTQPVDSVKDSSFILNETLLTNNVSDIILSTMMVKMLQIDYLIKQEPTQYKDLIDTLFRIGINCNLEVLGKYIEPTVIKKAMKYLSWLSGYHASKIVRFFMIILHSYVIKLSTRQPAMPDNQNRFKLVMRAMNTIVEMITEITKAPLYVPNEKYLSCYTYLNNNIIRYALDKNNFTFDYVNSHSNPNPSTFSTMLTVKNSIVKNDLNNFFNQLKLLTKPKAYPNKIFSDYEYKLRPTNFLKFILKQVVSSNYINNIFLDISRLDSIFLLLVLDNIDTIKLLNRNQSLYDKDTIYFYDNLSTASAKFVL